MNKEDNPVPSLDNKDLVSFLHTLIFQLGINIAHDYDGLESDEDIVIYQNSVIRRIKALQNGVETNNEQPKYLVMHSNYPIAFCNNKKNFLKEEAEGEEESIEFIPIKLGEID